MMEIKYLRANSTDVSQSRRHAKQLEETNLCEWQEPKRDKMSEMNTGPPILEYIELTGESPKHWKLEKCDVKNWI